MSTPRQGWRTFKCEECSYMWSQATRDSYSPSLETCPRCTEDCFPIDGWVDESLKVDKCANLIENKRISGFVTTKL